MEPNILSYFKQNALDKKIYYSVNNIIAIIQNYKYFINKNDCSMIIYPNKDNKICKYTSDYIRYWYKCTF
jgi:hypothetical protein